MYRESNFINRCIFFRRYSKHALFMILQNTPRKQNRHKLRLTRFSFLFKETLIPNEHNCDYYWVWWKLTSSTNLGQKNEIILWLYQTGSVRSLWMQQNGSLRITTILKQHGGSTFFLDILELLNILCVIPLENVEAERSFSCIRPIHNWLRSNMLIDRSENLAIKLCMIIRFFWKEMYTKPVSVSIIDNVEY